MAFLGIRFSLACIFAGAVFSFSTQAAPETCPQLLGALFHDEVFAARRDPDAVLSALQKEQGLGRDVLAIQGEFDCVVREGGGGACASASAFNYLQGLRKMAGFEETLNPHKVILGAFKAQPELLDGRVTNKQMVALLNYYRRYLPGHPIDISVEFHPQSTQASSGIGKSWADTGPNVAAKPDELKMLVYTITNPQGKLLGRHFVILKKNVGESVVVFDPNSPLKDYMYTLQKVKREVGSAFQLVRPKGAPPTDHVYDLDTVFTVKLEGKPTPLVHDSTNLSISQVTQKIDETVAAFNGTDKIISPRAWRKEAARYGLPALDLPRELGGAAWPPSKMVHVFEHAGEYDLNLRDVVGAAHARPLLKSDTPEVQEIARQVGRGEGYVAIAITEPDFGSNIRAMKSVSKKVEGGYALTGAKRYNARFSQASHIVVFTQAPDQAKGKLNAFVLPIGYPGLKFETLKARGLHGNSFGGVSFDSLFVPEKFRIGKDGEGGKIFREHFLYWRLMQASAAIGTGKGALKQMAERLRSRQAFGGPIGRFTHLQQELAEDTGKLAMASALVEKAAKLLDEGRYSEAESFVAMAKAEGVEFSLKAADDAMRAFGAEGYSDAVDLAQRKADLEGLRIADGTTDVLRQDVVRKVYGEDLWQMAIGIGGQ